MHPTAMPSTPEPLCCDVGLKGLARWLRAAGHDTLIAPDGLDDAFLLAWLGEGRRLLTADRGLARTARRATLVDGAGVDAQALLLRESLGLDWLYRPFSRCLVDNAELLPLPERARQHLPEAARALPGPFRRCPACGRVFWPGSHVRRMRAKLERWAAA
jgi:hypothetical protein